MAAVANVLVGLVAALHGYFLVLEMFLWEGKPGRTLSGFDADMARATAPLTAVPADPRAARTRAKLRDALLEECARRPLAEAGVTAVVRRAGVGRATFYLHYADLEALAVDACADVVREAVDALHAWRGTP